MCEGTYVAGTAFPHTETDTDSCSLHPDLDTHLHCCRAARRSRSHLQETKKLCVKKPFEFPFKKTFMLPELLILTPALIKMQTQCSLHADDTFLESLVRQL